MHLNKTIAIIDMGDVGVEAEALRQSMELFGYIVVIYRIGRPQHFIDILEGKTITKFDFIIIVCHGEDGEIIMPELGEDIYFPDEPRGNFSSRDIEKYLLLKDTCIINLGCTAGHEDISDAFAKNNNTYIASVDYTEGNSAFVFAVMFFYYVAQHGYDIETAYKKASAIDSETSLFVFKQ